MTAEALRQQRQALDRQLRQARRDRWGQRVRSVHRHWWYAAGVIGVMTVGAVGCRSWQQSQRDTALALASIAAPAPTPTTVAPVVEGVPNPLDGMPLTGPAKWTIGVGADGTKLSPMRSSAVVTALLQQLDLCSMFVGLDERAAIIVSKTPRPGFVPLVNCPASTTTTAKAAA